MQETNLKAIADAIREKDGTTEPIPARDFPDRIRAIQSGGIQLASISITTPPSKTAYTQGERFDPAGMVVRASYTNGAARNVTGYTVTPDRTLTTSDTKITVSFTEEGVTKTAAQTIGVQLPTVAVPTLSGSLTYTGAEQSPTWSGYDSTKMTIGGTTKAANAGTYSATFTLKSGWQWSDKTTAAKTVSWSIAKAAGSLSLSATAVTLNPSDQSKDITVTRAGDGAITAISSDTSVATVSVSGTTVTISYVNQATGTATVTIKVAAGTNHNAPADKTVTVTAQSLPAKKALNDMTWEEIRKVSDAGKASEYWNVGDAKKITVNGTVGSTAINMDVWAFILGFDHNSAKEGDKRVHFQIGKVTESGNQICFVDDTYPDYNANQGSFTMNPGAIASSKNAGGWKDSHMRKTVLGSENNPTSPTANTFMNALPSDLRAVMKPCTKYSDNTGGTSSAASAITATTDYLWLLAEFEVFGAKSYANQYEKNSQQQYDFYKANPDKMVKYKHKNTTSAAVWWLRSVGVSNTYNFCRVNFDGSPKNNFSGISCGVAPAFCV